MGDWVKKVKELKKNKIKIKNKHLIDTDSSMAITRGKRGLRKIEEGKVGIHDDGRRLDLGGERTIQCTGDIL